MQEIGFDELRSMLRAASKEILDNKSYLSELDANIGDGDHGSTIARTMETIEAAVEKGPRDDIKRLIEQIGWEVYGVNGGATGPLIGSLFLGLSEGMNSGEKICADALCRMFKRAREKVSRVSGASVGDKTMFDVLVPAVEAIEKSAPRGDICEMLDAAAEAAERGAESTVAMQARKGRARNLSEKSVGHKDPGAASLALLFKGFSRGARLLPGG